MAETLEVKASTPSGQVACARYKPDKSRCKPVTRRTDPLLTVNNRNRVTY